jgi:hypothetical protein
MNSNQRRILEMLAEKKITVDEAERLMSLTHPETGAASTSVKEGKSNLKYLRIIVKPNPGYTGEQENVNIRIPMALLRAGIKLTSVIPPGVYDQMDSSLKEKGISFDWRNLDPEHLEEVLAAINDLEIEVQNGKQNVHFFAE